MTQETTLNKSHPPGPWMPWALRKSLQLLHPAVLDGALQLLVECASRGANGTTFLCLGWKNQGQLLLDTRGAIRKSHGIRWENHRKMVVSW